MVGSIAHVPVAVWIQGRRRRLAIGCDLMIRPGSGLVAQLVSASLASEHALEVNFGVVNGCQRVSARLELRTP